MKRYIFILAAFAITLASCSKIYDATPVNHDQAIGFGTWTETMTKAHDPSGSSFAENDNFKVYGFKTLASGSANVFDGTIVTKGASDWTYAPLRFWDSNATSYTFFAFAPASLTSSTASQTSSVYNGTLSATATFNGTTDVLVAAKKEVSDYTSNVNLQFYHIASLLDLKVRKADNLELDGEDASNYIKVAVTSIELSQIDATGTFTIDTYDSANSNKPGKTTGEIWAADGSAAKATYNNTSGYSSVALDSGTALDIPTVTSGNFFTAIDKLVVMPQTFRTAYASAATEGNTDQTVTIGYKITVAEGGLTSETTYTASFDLKEFDDTPDTANTGTLIPSWAPGTHYTYIITIGANAITFTAGIQPWDATSNGYHYLTN